jgi:hypothetical protein
VKKEIEDSLSKIEFVANALANYRHGDILSTDGMYFVLTDVIEEIKEALEALEEKSFHIPANQAA